MTTIEVEMPDELAARLAPWRDRLPELLAIAVELLPIEPTASLSVSSEVTCPAFKEMMDFLVSGSTPEQTVAFKISPTTQERLEELLDKNREGSLTDDETTELDVYEQVSHLLILLKAHVCVRA